MNGLAIFISFSRKIKCETSIPRILELKRLLFIFLMVKLHNNAFSVYGVVHVPWRKIFVFICLIAAAYSETYEASKMKLSAKIVNRWKLNQLTEMLTRLNKFLLWRIYLCHYHLYSCLQYLLRVLMPFSVSCWFFYSFMFEKLSRMRR